jgi:catechol 2,3-dioxygenase
MTDTNIDRAVSTSGALLADETRLGGVELKITDLDRSLDFYTAVLGLSVHERGEGFAALGAGGEDLVTLRADAHAGPAGRHAGLYHYALLFPTREELARAGARVAATRTRIDGASDHGTHEAIYLPDPDGIGIELAADRPREVWPDVNGSAFFSSGPHPLDVGALFATVDGEGPTALAGGGLRMGHVHLHVGDLDAATRFYRDGLGFEVRAAMPSAAFVSVGGYHHHIAYNLWRGGGVGPVPDGVVGLEHWTLVAADQAELEAVHTRLEMLGVALEEREGGPSREAAGTLARDPSGIAVLIR